MLNITITEQTPHNMLRAIRAACNELLGETHADLTTQAAQANRRAVELHSAAEVETDNAAACLSRHACGGPVEAGTFYHAGETPSEQAVLASAFDKAVDTVGAQEVAHALVAPVDLDSTGSEWNPELHASTKTKNADGTWKKRRGAGKADDAPELPAATPGLTPLPPTPPAAPLVTMNDIYALISGGKCVLNDVLTAAQAMGFADVGAFSRDATPEQRAQLLAQLTKEVA